ncbi:MAG: class I SAM-dependent methyltransferase, partial [Nanoarchaeota archaeon]|nr:class I SAM-dependent methyltransferase [Nanoarchaeota archaeon]
DKLTEKQKRYTHLIDGRFFPNGDNPYQKDNQDWTYETPIDLDEELFYLHPLFDPRVLEVGAVRRFPQSVNRDYIAEKYFEDKWVSEGNNELALGLEKYVADNLKQLQSQEKIKLLDIGPCGGAITTLFALRALNRYNLLDKVEIYLLDIVPEVLEVTKRGDFKIPQEMIDEYRLTFAGKNGKEFKELMMSDRVHAIVGDGEKLPEEVKGVDIAVAAYVHHHMNLHARKKLAQQTEEAVRDNGFIGVTDFYVKNFEQYISWYKPHFEKCGTPPPVECPVIDGKRLASWYKNTTLNEVKDIENSFMFWGIR